ncbi:iron ABC transporter permease [Rhodohalobacter sp. SW132]|uniref:ABC transporter permease n=1 Tax=Rhodohalobacter sp. SW132 TaxID=2293433 RepID=UPI000E220C64|nr:iron ABC transporter permease [Rhodohalobacter sp. SW132]REL24327.1 iron ABC transporter permease [Rhodohalobacter sp. SW132]
MIKNLVELTKRSRFWQSHNTPDTGSSAWNYVTLGIALLVSIPIFTIIANLFVSSGDVWQHLASTVLPDYITNSLWLMIGVGIGVFVIGVGTAWLVTMCSFPGSRQFRWLLILPMAVPAYLLAYTYTDFLAFTGPVQNALRGITGWGYGDYWFPNIRSLWGAIVLMSLVFFPYVYLLTRAAFLEQSASLLEASRSLGASSTQSFFKIALPLARPSIAAGMALALMETLNDFGTVDYFGVQTFTTGIYRTWFGLGERVAAAQLSAFLMIFILFLILLERWSRSKMDTKQNSTGRYKRLTIYKLSGWKAWGSTLFCSIPILFGFAIPVGILVEMMITNFDSAVDSRFIQFSLNTILVAIIAGFVALLVALILAYGTRLKPTWLTKSATKIGSMGYAIPGSVIAVGILIPFGWADNTLDSWMRDTFGISTGLILSGSIVALIFAYVVRFLAVAFNTVEASLGKITHNMDEAAQGMGFKYGKILRKIHIPMMSGSLFAAIMLVVVDVIKELPATLIVRPFNFDTLAVQVYRLASDERLAESSGAALAIVLVGLIPVFILSRSIAKTRKTDQDKI